MPTATTTSTDPTKPPAYTPPTQGSLVPTVNPSTSYQPPATAPTANTTPPDASTYQVDAAKPSTDATVQGQLTSILGKNSGLLQQARSIGQRQASARGLTNSSIAVGAAQDATYRTALPIAQQDASTNSAFEMNDQQFKQSLAQAQQAFGYNQSLSAQNYNQSAQLSSQESAQQAAQALQQYGFASAQQLQQYLQQSGLSAQEANQAAQAAFQQYTQQSALSGQEAEQTLARDRLGFQNQAALNQQATELEIFRQERLAPLTEYMKKLDASLASELDSIQSQNDLVLQNSLAASQMYASGMQSLAQLYATPGLSAAQMTAGREHILDQIRGSLGFMAQIEQGFAGVLDGTQDTATPSQPDPNAPPTTTPPTTNPTTPPTDTQLTPVQQAIRSSPEFQTQLTAYNTAVSKYQQALSNQNGRLFGKILAMSYKKQMEDALKKLQAFDSTYVP